MRIRYLAALCCATLLMLIGIAPAANATSAYDDVISQGAIVLEQEGTHDITTSWRGILNASTNSYNLTSCLDDQVAGRGYGWGVSQVTYPAFGNVKQVRVWCTASESPAYFTNAEVGVASLHVPDAWQCNIYYSSGDYGVYCASSRGDRQIAHRESPWTFEQLDPVFINHPVHYPIGYAGMYPPDEYTPPPTTTLMGTVDCIDPANQPIYMYITQLGNSGYTTLTYSSPAVADWSYALTSAPYQITVGCGETLAASSGSVDPATTSEVWVCDIYSNPAECQTS